MDNLSVNEKERLQLIQKVQKMLSDGFSYADIATETRISTRTVARYRIGDPMNLCRLQRPSRHKLLDELKPRIIQLLQNGYHASSVYTQLVEEGYGVHKSTVRTYVRNLANSEGINICKNKKGPCPEKNVKIAVSEHAARPDRATLPEQENHFIGWLNQRQGILPKALF